MTVLAANVSGGRQNKAHQRALNVAPANAGSVFYVGAYLCREAATGVVIPGADTAGLVPLGVVVEPMNNDDPDFNLTAHLDNTAGADGTITVAGNLDTMVRVVRYDQQGEYAFAVESGTPKVGDIAYLFDDNTVDTAATTNGIIAGHFTRPAPNGGWFVDISKRGILSAGAGGAGVTAPTAGSRVAGGSIALDGSNPTAIATGLTTVTGFSATLQGSAAPGLGTSALTHTISSGTVSVYAWKPTGAGDTTLIASTGTETISWVAFGT
jgi:hypothetical protein